MATLADLNLAPKCHKVLQKLETGPVWVYGPTGSGRSELVKLLAAERDVIQVEPPGLNEADSPVHALAQCAVNTAGTACAFDDAVSLRERAHDLAKAAKQANKTLVVRAPASWSFAANSESADDARRRADALHVVNGWLEGTRGLVLLTHTLEETDPLAQLVGPDQSVNLPRVGIRVVALDDATLWGTYLDAARTMKAELARRSATLTPLQVRLSIGLVALGEDPRDLLAALTAMPSKSSLAPLVSRLRSRLTGKDAHLWAGLQAVAHARYPIPVEQALKLSGLDEANHPLLTQCVGYGGASIRLPEPVRDALLEDQKPQVREASHGTLAWHYQQLDGARSPLQLAGPSLHAWLEKAHHLAHTLVEPAASAECQQWRDLEVPSRHLLWDRARSLSRDHRRYEEAADLYRACIKRFGDDDYSWHYLGFNLDRARKERKEAEQAFRAAVQPEWLVTGKPNLGVANPWWNARLVTFLIARGRANAALEAWGAALDNIDPDRKRIKANPWLALHLHRWVVRAWLDVGDVSKARAVFDEIPAQVVEQEEELKLLKWRLEDAEEAIALVESVYPASVPPSDRWKQPQVKTGAVLATWAPGRVVSASKNGVVLVLAVMGPAGPERRVVRATIPAGEWRSIAWCPPTEATGFVEVHVPKRGARQIVPVAAAQPRWTTPGRDEPGA